VAVEEIQRKDGRIWSPIREKWLLETPEELVRQQYLMVLLDEYGYALDQIDEELEVTGRGSGHARADLLSGDPPKIRPKPRTRSLSLSARRTP
jgi:type I restriction enzyme M protein